MAGVPGLFQQYPAEARDRASVRKQNDLTTQVREPVLMSFMQKPGEVT